MASPSFLSAKISRYMLPPMRTAPMRNTQSPAVASAVAPGWPFTSISRIDPSVSPLIQPDARYSVGATFSPADTPSKRIAVSSPAAASTASLVFSRR
jgi:hypothetical protein